MPESRTEKSTFDLSGGLNTELHDLQWPDGFTAAEANYELLSDGTRRRRKGLASESAGVNAHQTVATITATQFNQSYKWKNVGGDPNKSFYVHQIGAGLVFTDDSETPSSSWNSQSLSAIAHTVEAVVVNANISDHAMRFTQGRGHLFVTGPYIEPFYVVYDAVALTFTTHIIKINYRDFEGIEDGIAMTLKPVAGTISADHRYNLRNRGYTDADIVAHESTNGWFPAKNSLWYKGYKRDVNSNTLVDPDGPKLIDSARFDKEIFGNSTAPQGSLFLNPFDTRFAGAITGTSTPIGISTWTGTPSGSANFTVQVTTLATHGYSVGEEITISGQLSRFVYNAGGFPHIGNAEWSMDGTHTITAENAGNKTFDFVMPEPPSWLSWSSTQYLQLGTIGENAQEALIKSDGTLVERSFEAIGFHAGRLWYAGLASTRFADHVFFTRILETTEAYGQCHQRNDPTDERFNDITAADGGVLVIPGMSGVKDMMTVGNSLVLVGTEGAWEIAGGRGSLFTATQFGVRQLTNANFNSPTGAIAVEDAAIATGPSGIYQFAPNEFTRLLEAKNMIHESIQTKWNQYTTAQQARVQVAYDDAKKRLYLMIGATAITNRYTEVLVLDTFKAAWFRYTFAAVSPFGLLSLFAISDADDSSGNQKMKFIYQSTTTALDVADFEQTDYLDFDGNESPLPFMVAGFDNLGDFQRRKQTPVITVFQKRTETGYTEQFIAGNSVGWEPDNESSTLMTAFWDWTEAVEWDSYATPTAQQAWTAQVGNHGISGKIGAQSQVYRHNRRFVPLAAGDVDGYPTVVTRNKVRGRGRVMQLRFDGATGKDSHIVGWTTNYKVSKKK